MFQQNESNLRIASVTSLKEKSPSGLQNVRSVPYTTTSPKSDETPVQLEFPPRQHDEPETDPLADPVPVISHVTSLHTSTAQTTVGVKIPPGIKLAVIPNHHAINTNGDKPRISVKTTAELSSTQQTTETPQPTLVELVPTNANGQKLLLTPKSRFSLVHNGKSTPIVLNTIQNQPFVVPLPNDGPLMIQGNQPNQKIMLVTNIPKANCEASSATSDKPAAEPMTIIPVMPKQLNYPITTNIVKSVTQTISMPIAAANISSRSQPVIQKKLTSQPDADKPEHTQQSMTAIRDVIFRTRKRTRLLQKKVDFVKLKISTYEAFISHLVRKNIISQKSAKELAVLEDDVNRYFKTRNRAQAGTNVLRAAGLSGGESVGGNVRNDDDMAETERSKEDHDYF